MTSTGAVTLGPSSFSGTHVVNGNLNISGGISTTAAHRGGFGLIPVGSVIAYNPGFYTNTANAGFSIVGPAGNSVAQVNTFLNTQGWYVCDGAAVNEAASPIWNAASRNLPNLSDNRFLMGATTAGTAAGTNTKNLQHSHSFTLAANDLPAHNHAAGTLAQALTGTTSFASSSHSHDINHSHQWGRVAGGSNVLRFWNSPGGGNASLNNDTYGNSQFPAVEYNTGASGAVVDVFATRQPMYTSGVSAGPNGTDGSARTGADNASASVSIGAMSGSTANNSTTNSAVTTSNGLTTSQDILPQYLTTYFIVRVF
jgi:hypothetical protein